MAEYRSKCMHQVVELRAVKAAGVSSHPLGSLLKGDDYVTVASPTSPLAVSEDLPSLLWPVKQVLC